MDLILTKLGGIVDMDINHISLTIIASELKLNSTFNNFLNFVNRVSHVIFLDFSCLLILNDLDKNL